MDQAQLSPVQEYLERQTAAVDAALDDVLPSLRSLPKSIHQAMRHVVFAGGKRLRPVLCLAAAEACGGRVEDAMPLACAVELMHTYSLVHDDLPCMDDDDLRRGRPTCHKAFGEAVAVLCGDALLTLAFGTLAKAKPNDRFGVARFVGELAFAGDSVRLIGGQVMDMEAEGKQITRADLDAIHESKTAALFVASLRLGAMSAGASNTDLTALGAYGRSLGLAFQVMDDILDVTRTSEELGKTAGKDKDAGKATYPSVAGMEIARREAARQSRQAIETLAPLRNRGARLAQLAEHLSARLK